jgi:hypothetical protein
MIEQLSQDQINLFPEYVKKWTEIGFNADPINKEKATKAIHLMYEKGGLTPPQKIIFCTGPTQLVILQSMLKYKEENPQASKEDIISHANTIQEVSDCGYGQHDATWLSYYDYFDNECKLEGMQQAHGLMEVAKECGWYCAFDTICLVSEKPCILHVNDMNMLHCDNGPALAYNDGTEIYAYEGVIVNKDIIMTPNYITIDLIEKEESEEIKRVMIEIYGVSKYLTDIKAEVVDIDTIVINPFEESSESMPRALIKDVKGNKYFVGTDGSTHRTYYMHVPPEVETCADAHNAISPIDESDIIANS